MIESANRVQQLPECFQTQTKTGRLCVPQDPGCHSVEVAAQCAGACRASSLARAMSSELLVDLGDDPASAQLGQLKLATIEDQQWPADESTLGKSGEADRF